jgi:glucose-1-phosphate thymidylyltransferase
MAGLVGLVPAAGQASRLAPLTCSKEIFPVGFRDAPTGSGTEPKPKPIALYVMESMAQAGAERVMLIVSRDKWDIPRYFGGGSEFGMRLSYLVQEGLAGMPFALDTARPWLRDETVLFGMPDTIFEPRDAFRQMLAEHRRTGACVTLGLFPTAKPERFGMVAFDSARRLLYTIDKPAQSDLEYMWGIGCWEPGFTEFMGAYLQTHERPAKEIVLADIFQAALQARFDMRVVPFAAGEYVDIGTPADLAQAVRRFAR